MSHRTRIDLRPGRMLAALVAGAALVLGAGIAPAAAVPTTVPSLDIQVASVDKAELREYGSWTQAARKIAIGPSTGSVRVDATVFGDLAVTTGEVWCQLKLQQEPWPVVASRRWSAAEWAVVADRTLPLPPGVVNAGTGARWVGSCGAFEGTATSNIRWLLIEDAAAPANVEFGADPRLLVSQNTLTAPQAEETVIVAVPGDRIRLYAEPGTWDLDGVTPLAVSLTEGSTGIRVPAVEVGVTADRSVLGFTVPEVSTPEFGRAAYRMEVTAYTVTPGTSTTPAREAQFQFVHDFSVTRTKPPTVTTLTLSRHVTASLGTVTATAKVTTPGNPYPVGTVAFHVDGKRVASVSLVHTDKGVAAIPMPRLSRGVHDVLVTFSGTADSGEFLANSVSSTQRLLVVR
ncbi:Ig-like domain-containing protein [Diaminobutyricimonas aerilata]|uniref:Ig-like domain-containing protein n=1 Tax=Diaminobutyricimonas aerilata TaxID=1162967 RepID=A0A2M9CHJ9_9MICO|nr:Ig-like domain repeat protein [Diaminobutyricimonas aerilata]PJJ71391.1 Ig-like domain-containing protein [Diaminobutyricimonas aerilata]